jgi:hypothetical protein
MCREIEELPAGTTEAATKKMREGPWQSAFTELNRVRLYLDSNTQVTLEGSDPGAAGLTAQHPGF